MYDPVKPNSILILGNRTFVVAVITHSYLNHLFSLSSFTGKAVLWKDEAWTNLRYRKIFKNYHQPYLKLYRPAKLFEREEQVDIGLRKLYDEMVLRRSNRHSQSRKIIYLESVLNTSGKPRIAMLKEILQDGGRKCNIQFIANAMAGSGQIDHGHLLRRFDIRIATLPLSKPDSLALFGSSKYATEETDDFIYFGYGDSVEKVPIFSDKFPRVGSDSFLELIRYWVF